MLLLKRVFATFATLVLLPVQAFEEPDVGPEPLAANFMAQFYDVPAESVAVTLNDSSEFEATAVAKVKEHSCVMEMTKAPAGVHAPFGWLVGSMQCEQ